MRASKKLTLEPEHVVTVASAACVPCCSTSCAERLLCYFSGILVGDLGPLASSEAQP